MAVLMILSLLKLVPNSIKYSRQQEDRYQSFLQLELSCLFDALLEKLSYILVTQQVYKNVYDGGSHTTR